MLADTMKIALGEDTKLDITVHRFVGSGEGPSVYIQAGLHGNEHPGIMVTARLIKKIETMLDKHKLNGTITIVPLCNPIAFSQTVQGEIVGRFDVATGKNFNRYFPDLSRKVVEKCNSTVRGDIDARAIRSVLRSILKDEPKAVDKSASDRMKSQLFQLALEHDVVIDLHADNCSLLHIYTSEKETTTAEMLATELGCELLLSGVHSAEGGFDDAVNYFWSTMNNELQNCKLDTLPNACTVELRGRYNISEELAAQDANGLYRFLCQINAIECTDQTSCNSKSTAAGGNKTSVFPIDGIDSVQASRLGVLKLHKKLGAYVSEGDLIAEIADPNDLSDNTTVELRSATTGVLFCHSFHGVVPPGQTVYKIAGTKKLHKKSGSALEQ